MRIFVWPDGSWQCADEYFDALSKWKGDDFIEILVDSWWDEEDIDRAAMDAVSLFLKRKHTMTNKYEGEQAQGGGEAGQWVNCSPALLSAGVSCALTPRRAGSDGRSHEHFISHLAPPSVPVGVEGLPAKWRAEADEIAANNWACNSNSIRARADELERVLAQQPAAVDEAMERLRTHRNWKLWQADLVGGQISVDRMRAILTEALAVQPRGSDNGSV